VITGVIAAGLAPILWSSGSSPRAAAAAPVNMATGSPLVILGYNELGMHCMNEDFSELCILPPFNTMRADVIDRSRSEPQIVTSGVTLSYSIPGNTHSTDKTNFWTYAPQLFGKTFAPDTGLTGNKLKGTLSRTAAGFWEASGIPVTPLTDAGKLDPYQRVRLTATRNGVFAGISQPVIPVSWEISCNLCHNAPGASVATNILRAHDRRHGTQLEASKPVLCAKCHADPALGAAGTTGVPNLSNAMHMSHASRMSQANLAVSCYACHPGIRTQCQRDVHYSKGMNCLDCHGGMAQVGDAARRPWQDEPKCGTCHTKPGYDFEEPGLLYKMSRGHRGVHCAACHGSPHAIAPTVTGSDAMQPINRQGQPGPIRVCVVCHQSTPGDPFPHRIGE
jgi:hypothetical protein